MKILVVDDDRSILRTLDLHLSSFVSEFKDDSPDLRPTCCPYGMAFGKQSPIDIDRDDSILVRFFATKQILPLSRLDKTQVLVGHDF